ncbi:thioredoxin family protein [Pedobacter sp.]|uniref:thioredoxin family protein n=1 Tax=Pedobacter sp. TaxID=1411316 RepID=UPI003D7F42B8
MIEYNTIFEESGLTYTLYRELIDQKLSEGKTTGTDHADAMLHYTKMNVQRMSRLDKTIPLNAEFLEVLTHVKGIYRLLVITEGWCGDAAQLVPLFNKIVLAAPAHFDLRLVLRDEHLNLIDAHLTNLGRAIPILLIVNEKGEVVNKWGPRPALLSPLLADWKKESDDMMVTAEKLHSWYAKDKTLTTQKELTAIFRALA